MSKDPVMTDLDEYLRKQEEDYIDPRVSVKQMMRVQHSHQNRRTSNATTGIEH